MVDAPSFRQKQDMSVLGGISSRMGHVLVFLGSNHSNSINQMGIGGGSASG